MKYCETCKWADDNGQSSGTAVCRKRPPLPLMLSNNQGQMATIGAFPPVTLSRDGCAEHEEGREKIHLARVRDIPGINRP